MTLISDSALNDGTWHHIVAQMNSNVLSLYVDGALQGSTVDDNCSDINICTETDNIHIGARRYDYKLRRRLPAPAFNYQWPPKPAPVRYETKGDNHIYPFSGSVNLFKIFNKSLSGGEISSLYRYKRDSAIIGNIFYNNGIMCITDLSGSYNSISSYGNDWTLKFKNSYPVTVHNYKCVVEDGEYNVTLNPTARDKNDPNSPKLRGFASASHFSPYITTIGLYSDANELLAIGKLAYPVKSPKEIDITFNVQFDT